jgi:predicted amidohydrolase YtcJ
MHTSYLQRVILVALLLVSAVSTGADEQKAELVLRGGKIVTLDDSRPIVQALAARGGKIIAVGDNERVSKLIGAETEVISLDGRLAIPGFIEGHGHFVGLGKSKMTLDLTKAETWEDIIRQVKQAAQTTPRGEWIIGRGWHQSKWKKTPEPNVDGCPIHTKLSAVTPHHPVLLTHASGHMSIANAAAMRMANVNASTPDPRGGEILRDQSGNPIGVFRETAQSLVGPRGNDPARKDRDLKKAIELAMQECLTKGITSFQDAGSSFETIDIFKQLAEAGQLKIRLWVMVGGENSRMARLLPKYRMIGVGDDHLTVRAIKRFIDGALGAHGAWLLAPYNDLPSSVGLNTSSVESIRRTAELARKYDFQLCVHAIGDRANREILNIFEDALRDQPDGTSRRWRVEHAQHLHPDDIPRFSQLGVIASMQGVHCTSDAPYVIKRLGHQRAAEGAYVWQSLIQSGAIVVNGTDAPVEDVDPIACFYASVTRKLPSGAAFFPEQRMTREQALRSYTTNAAYAAFEEHVKGSLSPGKLADIVVLSRDIMTCPDEEILQAKVVYTIVGGDILYERP